MGIVWAHWETISRRCSKAFTEAGYRISWPLVRRHIHAVSMSWSLQVLSSRINIQPPRALQTVMTMSDAPVALALPHGQVSFPAFLPDATYGVVRSVDSTDLRSCNVPAVVMNAFHLM